MPVKRTKEPAMRLFKSDLYRSFAIGFLIGTAGLVATMGVEARAQIVAAHTHTIGAQSR
ncbi:MAG: hypothetical protein NVSMB69_06190 [Novosphingobium sp.]|jgi:hypothetical protein